MSRNQGADELRIRATLIKQGVGPDADPAPVAPPKPAVPPKPTARPRDWLDDLLDSNGAEPEPDPEPDEEPADGKPEAVPARKTVPAPKSGRKGKRKGSKKPKPGAPRTAWDSRPPSPRQSLIEAYDNVPYRLRWLAYHATAAYMGWSMGLVDYATYVTRWIADTGFGPQAWFWCGAGAATVLLHRRTRGLWWPIAWCAAIPVTSTVVGVLLYGTPHI
ncbi:hypothetical protein [Streptomyces turgidiscabies]|uniref:hypothetical protein n=1 Tax=Streptomyces turgidiscabies TaxID=85558 RepID=UPI0038F654BD